MRLVIVTINGGTVEVEDFDQDTAMDLIEAFKDSDTSVLHVALDNPEINTYILKHNICRIDLLP